MKKIILDTSILIRFPKILGLEITGTKFIVPITVIDELVSMSTRNGNSNERIVDLIERATAQGNVDVINTDLPGIRKYFDTVKTPRLSSTDTYLLATALFLKEKGDITEIATLDRVVMAIASKNGINCIGTSHILELINSFVTPTSKINTVQSEIVNYETKEKQTFWSGIAIGIVFTAVAILIYQNLSKILQSVNIWGTIILIILLGIGLFVYREKKRLSYGVFEFSVGVIAIIMLFKPIGFNYSEIDFNLDFNIKLLGGLYIMVRGQDNIVRSQKDKKIGLFLKDKFGIGN